MVIIIQKHETASFDKEIIKLTGKTNPNFLFIGLANKYPDYYFEVMDGIYNGMYGCKTDYLRYEEIKDKEITNKKIKNTDIIYVGGGNTYKLMRLLKFYGVDEMLVNAYNDGKGNWHTTEYGRKRVFGELKQIKEQVPNVNIEFIEELERRDINE